MSNELPTIENGLSPEMVASFERIKELAKINRRQYAIGKSRRFAARPSRPSPTKKRKPFYYNPASRD